MRRRDRPGSRAGLAAAAGEPGRVAVPHGAALGVRRKNAKLRICGLRELPSRKWEGAATRRTNLSGGGSQEARCRPSSCLGVRMAERNGAKSRQAEGPSGSSAALAVARMRGAGMAPRAPAAAGCWAEQNLELCLAQQEAVPASCLLLAQFSRVGCLAAAQERAVAASLRHVAPHTSPTRPPPPARRTAQ